ncbi:MAG: hypothetical protein ABS64_00190 [Microbacterium sp. SCN 69-37]|nr:MAG: hypothetical protein ABS64_00190 [Microbacterium sp. SCN 69-37]
MTVEHDEHWYVCLDCGGEGMLDVQVSDDPSDTEWSWCPECGDGMSRGLGQYEGDDDDCAADPCGVATGAIVL